MRQNFSHARMLTFLLAALVQATACRGSDASGATMPPLKVTYMVDNVDA